MSDTNELEFDFENNGTTKEFTREDYNKMSESQIKQMAESFGEGNKGLTELLEYTVRKGILTIASCGGHSDEKQKSSYIVFKIDDENIAILSGIFEEELKQNSKMFFSGNGYVSNFEISVDPNNSSDEFSRIKKQLQKAEIEKNNSQLFEKLCYVTVSAEKSLEFTVIGEEYRKVNGINQVAKIDVKNNEYLAQRFRG